MENVGACLESVEVWRVWSLTSVEVFLTSVEACLESMEACLESVEACLGSMESGV